MHPKDAAGIANSVNPDQTLIRVCIVCPDLSVRKLRIITVYENTRLCVIGSVHGSKYIYDTAYVLQQILKQNCIYETSKMSSLIPKGLENTNFSLK